MKNQKTISVIAGVAISTLSSAALATTPSGTTGKLVMLDKRAPNPVLAELSPEMQKKLDAYRSESNELIKMDFLLVRCQGKVCPPPMQHDDHESSFWSRFIDFFGTKPTGTLAGLAQSKTDKEFS